MKLAATTIVFLATVGLLFTAPVVIAAEPGDIEVTPKIIDEDTKVRDILDYTIKVKNNRANHVFFYTFVYDLDEETGQQNYDNVNNLDKRTSLASWVKIRRGETDLAPGEEVEIPLKIEVNMNALPGIRHAAVIFAEGSDGYAAESLARAGSPYQVVLNLKVREETVERAQLVDFKSRRNIYFEPPAEFSLTVKNIGNSPVSPAGFLYLYNRRGEEIDKLAVNEDRSGIMPDTVKFFSLTWPAEKRAGKFRVKLELAYGQTTQRDLQDTLYIYIFPWVYLAVAVGGVLLLIIILSIILFKRTYHYHHPPVEPSDGVINLRRGMK